MKIPTLDQIQGAVVRGMTSQKLDICLEYEISEAIAREIEKLIREE